MKTVKRKANVGERILITDRWSGEDRYENGAVFTVLGLWDDYEESGDVCVFTEGKGRVLLSEYEVIIENKTKSEAVGMENAVQKRGSLMKKVVPTDDYHETMTFTENADGTFSLNFKQMPALVHVSYDGNGTFDQTFIHGEYKAEAQRIKIESAVGELTSYTIDSLAVLKPVEDKTTESIDERRKIASVFFHGKHFDNMKSPQEIRDDIVAQAKRDVAELESANYMYGNSFDYVVDHEKRTVVALGKITRNGKVVLRGIAKCDPSDCFNSHIGKAIALRRALGLEVPAEYFQAPQPTEVRVGDVVHDKCGRTAEVTDAYSPNRNKVSLELSGHLLAEGVAKGSLEIVDDSREKITQ